MSEGIFRNKPNCSKRQIGDVGESRAEAFLKGKGFLLISKNFSTRWGELDLIMKDGSFLVFVEVRHRRSTDYGSPEESITPFKIKHLVRAAVTFLNATKSFDRSIRFDVVCVVPGEIRHIKNAFQIDESFYI